MSLGLRKIRRLSVQDFLTRQELFPALKNFSPTEQRWIRTFEDSEQRKNFSIPYAQQIC